MEQVRVAIYCRVSTDEQAESGYSIPEQKRELLAHAEREGWEVIGEPIVDDGYSGAVGIRPGLDQITRLAEAQAVDVVLAKKRDRFFRDRYIRMGYERSLKQYGVKLVALDDTGHRIADAVMDEFGDWYREVVRENTIAGKMEKARQGKLIATRTPLYGFDFSPNREGYVVVPDQMAVVERIFRAVASGKPIHTVATELEKDGVPAPRGGMVWREKTIRRVIFNDAYRPHPYEELAPLLSSEARSELDHNTEYGVVWYPQREVTLLDPDPGRNYRRPTREQRRARDEQVPIPVVTSGINREVMDAAREAVRGNLFVRNSSDRVFQLSGSLFCGVCGSPMAANNQRRKARTYHYYRCPTNQRNRRLYGSGERMCSMSKGFAAEKLERTVLDALLDAVKNRDELIQKANEDYQREREAILRSGAVDAGEWYRRLESLEHQKARLQHAYAEGVIDLDDLRARTADLDRERDYIKRLIAEQENRQERLQELQEGYERTVELIRRGKWGELGITAPTARRERYREIGLRAKAYPDGTVELSWGVGEKNVISTKEPISG